MMKIHTYYDDLKVTRDAPQEVIKAAYRSLSQKFHPDRNHANPEAARIMSALNTSYGVLSDPEKRREYDQGISRQENGTTQESSPTSQDRAFTEEASTPGRPRTSSNPDRGGIPQHFKSYWSVYMIGVVLMVAWPRDKLSVLPPVSDTSGVSASGAPTVKGPHHDPATATGAKKSAQKTEPHRKSLTTAGAPSPPALGELELTVKEGGTDSQPVDGPINTAKDHRLQEYGQMLSREIGRDQRYPRRAQMLGWEGTTEVLVHMGADANVMSASVNRSSGHELLDEEALEQVRRVRQLPPPPDGFRGRKFTVMVPIAFRLE